MYLQHISICDLKRVKLYDKLSIYYTTKFKFKSLVRIAEKMSESDKGSRNTDRQAPHKTF